MPRIYTRRSEEDRFWEKVDTRRLSPGGCWEWLAGLTHNGYGQFKSSCTSKAHRWSYLHHYGKIPDGLLVCHRCDNPPCVNPAHLVLGTTKDNMQDKCDRGRQLRGEGHGRAGRTRSLRLWHSHIQGTLCRTGGHFSGSSSLHSRPHVDTHNLKSAEAAAGCSCRRQPSELEPCALVGRSWRLLGPREPSR